MHVPTPDMLFIWAFNPVLPQTIWEKVLLRSNTTKQGPSSRSNPDTVRPAQTAQHHLGSSTRVCSSVETDYGACLMSAFNVLLCSLYRDENSQLADIFLKKGPYLKMYSTYIREFDKNVALLEEQTKRNLAFGAVVREFEVMRLA